MSGRSRWMARLRQPLPWSIDGYFMFRSDLGTWRSRQAGRPPQDGLAIEEVTAQDSQRLAGLVRLMGIQTGHRPEIEVVSRELQSANRCFVATANGHVVAMRWIAGPGSGFYRGFAALVRKEPESRVFHRAYVHPDYRGHRLQRRLDTAMKRALKQEGVMTTYVFVGVYNFASVHNCLRCNDEVRLIYHLRVDPPLIGPMNVYPALAREPWKACEAVVRGV